jgi:hypothetical protein
MTSENLSQSGHVVNLDNYPIGKQAYLYKPPSMDGGNDSKGQKSQTHRPLCRTKGHNKTYWN